jgi:hypothetical protein
VIVGVAATASDVVAVTESIGNCAGTCPPQAEPPVVLWTSTDARRWVPHSVPLKWLPLRGGAVPLIAAGPAGFVIASPGSAPRLVISTDGTTWRALAAGALPPGFVLAALAGTRSGYVGAGSAAISGRSEAATVESSDGDHWPVSPTLLPSTSANARGSTITGLMVGRAGLLATGTTSAASADALWWQSADGRHWRALPTFAPLGPAPCAQVGCGRTADGVVVGDGDQLLALRASPLAAAWVSIDGLAWRRLQSSGMVPGQPPVGAVLMPGGVLLTYLSTTWLGTAHS